MAWELVQQLGARFHDPHGFPQKKTVQCKWDDDFFKPMAHEIQTTPLEKKVASLKKTSRLGFGVLHGHPLGCPNYLSVSR